MIDIGVTFEHTVEVSCNGVWLVTNQKSTGIHCDVIEEGFVSIEALINCYVDLQVCHKSERKFGGDFNSIIL